jgi:Na+-transporting methylmalonyl-CoA/oxaloacetate decarboxylase gamma subunit
MFHLLLAADPSVPNDVGGKFVAGAYVVFIVLLLVYVAIMAMKLVRIERGLGEVAEIAEQRRDEGAAETAEPVAAATTHTVTPGPAASGRAAQETRP